MEFRLVSAFNAKNITIFFLTGGGQTPFSSKHRFIRYIQKVLSEANVFTVVLPGHGNHHLTEVLTPREYVDRFYKDFKHLLEENQVNGFALIGFTLGGLLSLKLV